MNEFEKELKNFYKSLAEKQIDAPPEFQKIIDENFWDLLGNDNEPNPEGSKEPEHKSRVI